MINKKDTAWPSRMESNYRKFRGVTYFKKTRKKMPLERKLPPKARWHEEVVGGTGT